jgi:hypothetical protein
MKNVRRTNREESQGNQFCVFPDLGPKQDFAAYGSEPRSITLSAVDGNDAIRRAVVSGFIPSNSVMQYYKAVRV